MTRRLTDRQLEKLQEWADRTEAILEHPNGDDCMIVGRSTLELLIRLIGRESGRSGDSE